MENQAKLVFLLRREVEARTRLATATIYKLMAEGIFPKSIPLTPSGRYVGWLESEVESYLQDRIDAARANTPDAE